MESGRVFFICSRKRTIANGQPGAMEASAALQAVPSGLKMCLESMASSPTAIGQGLSKATWQYSTM